jgi:hypothetical protein
MESLVLPISSSFREEFMPVGAGALRFFDWLPPPALLYALLCPLGLIGVCDILL